MLNCRRLVGHTKEPCNPWIDSAIIQPVATIERVPWSDVSDHQKEAVNIVQHVGGEGS